MSKFMYFDFKCNACEIVTEQFVKPDFTPLCEKCGSELAKLISAGTRPITVNDDRWVKMNKQKTKQDKKFYADHGVDKMHHSYGS